MNAIELMEPTEARPATPLTLVQMAIDQGADLDRLERLMALQVQWEEREAKKAYNVAFAAFKDEAVRIIKNRAVTDGPLKGKRYAELYAVVNAITPALSKHGLSASWKLTKDDKDWIEVTCALKHVGGYSEAVSMGGPPDSGGAKNAIMARASTVSYLERYTLKAITGLSEQEDDNDGGHGAGGDPGDDGELVDAARAEAMKGSEAYRVFFTMTCTADDRRRLARHHASLKSGAEAADKRMAA